MANSVRLSASDVEWLLMFTPAFHDIAAGHETDAYLRVLATLHAAKEGGGEPAFFTASLGSDNDNKVRAIKALRIITGLGLKEAKHLVEGRWARVPSGDLPFEAVTDYVHDHLGLQFTFTHMSETQLASLPQPPIETPCVPVPDWKGQIQKMTTGEL